MKTEVFVVNQDAYLLSLANLVLSTVIACHVFDVHAAVGCETARDGLARLRAWAGRKFGKPSAG